MSSPAATPETPATPADLLTRIEALEKQVKQLMADRRRGILCEETTHPKDER